MATRRSARTRKQVTTSSLDLTEASAEDTKKIVWEWEGDGGKWTKYDDQYSIKITKALTDREDDVILQVAPTVKLNVRFNSMTQMNVRTGWQRDVRCLSNERAEWEWQDEHGKWNKYSPSVQRLLVACQECGVVERKLEAAGRRYKVDLVLKKQTNLETRVMRKVRVSGGDEATASKKSKLESDEATPTASKATASKKSKLESDEATPTASKATGSKKPKLESDEATPTARKATASKKPKLKIEEATLTARKATASKKSKLESDEATLTASKATASKSSATKSSGKASSSEVEKVSSDRVVVAAKGSVPVDYACTQKVGKAQVYSEGGEHWDAMLNQTNLKNNNNKFYILQLLQDDGPVAKYNVWFRWGRVGKTGQSSLFPCGSDLEEAKCMFTKKFSDKTSNSWEDKDSFVKVAGKYDLLKIDYEAEDEADRDAGEEVDGEEVVAEEDDSKPPESKLDPRLQSLIQLICNVKAMEEMVIEMKYDAQKAPLGKLTTNQIHLGYAALKKIEDCINKGHYGDRLCQACDEFYTRIPHSFGMSRPPLIKTKEMVKEKIALLEALGDIQIAMKVLSGDNDASKEHPIDRHYSELKCKLSPVDTEDSYFALVDKYMQQTHAKTHNQYSLQLVDLFAVDRDREAEQFKDVGNRKLLWHGSRLTNWVGVLSQGLRIAPPEAPVTGYMFGKGIYFADMCSKSANYCFASKAKNDGLILLCDVSLGHTNDLLAADYNAQELPRGKHSVMGLGRVAPNPSMNHTLSDGCIVPLGTSIDTGVTNPHGYTLNYNEYIVYDVKQVKMKYLARVKFNFK